MYIFKYHPDGWIGRHGVALKSYKAFLEENPSLEGLLIEGQFFEYDKEGDKDIFHAIQVIKNTGIGILQTDLGQYKPLIDAINNLQ